MARGGARRPGVLALQGSVEPHLHAFASLGHDPVEVRKPRELEQVTHLVLPGGESTTLQKLLALFDLWEPLFRRGAAGELALFGTCAGAILLGRESEERPPRLGLLDVTVDRNAYGRQIDSFTAEVTVRRGKPLEGVFIRAPRFRDPGKEVEVLGTREDEPVLVRQGRRLASTFHPELTRSTRLHEYFLTL